MDVIQQWYTLKQELARIKKEEAALRRRICETLFNGRQGEFTVETETDDYTLKATSKVSRSIDETTLKSLLPELSEEEKTCVRWKASLDTRRWRKLPDNSLLNQAVVEKPAMPTLTLEVKI